MVRFLTGWQSAMNGSSVNFELNGRPVTVLAAAHARLIDVLRESLGPTGTKEGCREGECGACTVLVNGRAISSCPFPALKVEGRFVLTIEGLLGRDLQLGPVPRSFVEQGGV